MAVERKRINRMPHWMERIREDERYHILDRYLDQLGLTPDIPVEGVLYRIGKDLIARGFKSWLSPEWYGTEMVGSMLMTPGGYVIDRDQKLLLTPNSDKPIELTKHQCHLLYELMLTPGRPVLYQHLGQELWPGRGYTLYQTKHRLPVLVYGLRRKIGDYLLKTGNQTDWQLIRNRLEVGYEFTDKVISPNPIYT